MLIVATPTPYRAIGRDSKASGIVRHGGYDIVQGHHDVGSYVVLVMYAIFGTEEHSLRFRRFGGAGRARPLPSSRRVVVPMPTAVLFGDDVVVVVAAATAAAAVGVSEGILERHALLRDFRQFEQRHHLEPPAVGEDVPIPSHEFVQSALRAGVTDELRPGLQSQMIGIRQYYPIVQRLAMRDVHGGQPLQRALGPHRHEHGGGNGTVTQVQGRVSSPPGRRVDVEIEGRMGGSEIRRGVHGDQRERRGPDRRRRRRRIVLRGRIWQVLPPRYGFGPIDA